MPPDSLSPEQLIAILERVGFYRDSEDSNWFSNSDNKRAKGPAAVYLDVGSAISLPVGIIRLYLLRQELHPDYLDEAIRKVLG